MALIEYIEPLNGGELFVGIGSLILTCTLAYIFYRLYIKMVQYIDLNINRASKYEILEESYLDKLAESKGIDLNKELIKRKMLEDKKPKSLRKKIEEQVFEDFFPKGK